MLNRRQLLSAMALAPAAAQSGAKRPNFVFILTDDQRWDALGVMGHPCLKTPNMDRIAREGVRFANAFVTTSLCSPSRASFLTGKYARRHGVKDNLTEVTRLESFATILQRSGYETAQIGKWHMGESAERPGFSHSVTFPGQGVYNDPVLTIDGKSQKVPGYLTDLLTDYSVNWIERQRSAPFCLFLGHKACHLPTIPPPRHENVCASVALPKPPSANSDLRGKPAWVSQRADTKLGGVRRAPDYLTVYRKYLQTLPSVDEGIGRIFESLERTAQLENTVLIFCGDNGFLHGEHNLTNKRAAYEESIRIPFLMRYPKAIRPGTVAESMVLNIDLAPTILSLAGLPVPGDMQGKSLLPVFRNPRLRLRDRFFYEYFEEPGYIETPTMEGMRTLRWKYVTYPGKNDTDELYDLSQDPYELNNLAAGPQTSFVAKIRKEFQDLRRTI
ncbi:MAG: sulfatase [Bryobacteraceae bacterium]|nr:sulfatase [Bryobacteraceae bacterium]